ncbi:MAG: glutathione S-transferase [Proteobacteria bacterium]|nr:MAG: glutathione S-transferase [Pseudomonadota bacterium]
MTTQLVALSYSPWSEKARWALDHHQLTYVEQPYVPIFGELGLRVRARQLGGQISVPALLDNGAVVVGSWEIVRHLEERGGARSLIPDSGAQEVERWSELSERLLAAGRTLVTHRVSLDAEAKRESLPSQVPQSLAGMLRPLADIGIAFLRRKYGFGTAELGACEDVLAQGLLALRAALAARPEATSPATLLSRFSYADIAMALALQCVSPVDDRYITLGPASRRCWSQPRLLEQFGDLIEWRDAIYATYR